MHLFVERISTGPRAVLHSKSRRCFVVWSSHHASRLDRRRGAIAGLRPGFVCSEPFTITSNHQELSRTNTGLRFSRCQIRTAALIWSPHPVLTQCYGGPQFAILNWVAMLNLCACRDWTLRVRSVLTEQFGTSLRLERAVFSLSPFCSSGRPGNLIWRREYINFLNRLKAINLIFSSISKTGRRSFRDREEILDYSMFGFNLRFGAASNWKITNAEIQSCWLYFLGPKSLGLLENSLNLNAEFCILNRTIQGKQTLFSSFGLLKSALSDNPEEPSEKMAKRMVKITKVPFDKTANFWNSNSSLKWKRSWSLANAKSVGLHSRLIGERKLMEKTLSD